jgi:hypothetical protein
MMTTTTIKTLMIDCYRHRRRQFIITWHRRAHLPAIIQFEEYIKRDGGNSPPDRWIYDDEQRSPAWFSLSPFFFVHNIDFWECRSGNWTEQRKFFWGLPKLWILVGGKAILCEARTMSRTSSSTIRTSGFDPAHFYVGGDMRSSGRIRVGCTTSRGGIDYHGDGHRKRTDANVKEGT